MAAGDITYQTLGYTDRVGPIEWTPDKAYLLIGCMSSILSYSGGEGDAVQIKAGSGGYVSWPIETTGPMRIDATCTVRAYWYRQRGARNSYIYYQNRAILTLIEL